MTLNDFVNGTKIDPNTDMFDTWVHRGEYANETAKINDIETRMAKLRKECAKYVDEFGQNNVKFARKNVPYFDEIKNKNRLEFGEWVAIYDGEDKIMKFISWARPTGFLEWDPNTECEDEITEKTDTIGEVAITQTTGRGSSRGRVAVKKEEKKEEEVKSEKEEEKEEAPEKENVGWTNQKLLDEINEREAQRTLEYIEKNEKRA